MKRSRPTDEPEPALATPKGLPSAPAPRHTYDIRQDIQRLEATF